jgi:hypothetical protein
MLSNDSSETSRCHKVESELQKPRAKILLSDEWNTFHGGATFTLHRMTTMYAAEERLWIKIFLFHSMKTVILIAYQVT